MEKTIQPGMNQGQVIEILVDQRVNERFGQMKAELNEQLAHWRQCESAAQVDGEPFYRLQSYITTLCTVQSVDHNVHKELDEAILKLKELAYT